MINFGDYFKSLEIEQRSEQRRLPINSCLNVYYGLTLERHYRISFVSTIPPIEFQSTKEIKITQGKEADNIYWTCFDLLKNEAKDVFFIFCDSLIATIENICDEYEAINNIKDRYHSWKVLLKNKTKMTYENYQGLFGELYFMLEILSKEIGIDNALKSWVGPDGYSKDFSTERTWYEVKTIGTSSTTIKINSLTQLESDIDGHLIKVVVEKMSDQFNEGLCSVPKLYNYIFDMLPNRYLKEMFVNKMLKYGYVDEDENINKYKFEVANVSKYLINNDFPKLTRKDVKNLAITQVKYELLLSSIEEYKEN